MEFVPTRPMSSLLMLRTLYGALRKDGLSPSAGVDIQTDVESVTFNFPAPFPYQLDGDYLGETTNLEIRHCPDALRLVRPSFADY